MAVSGAHLHLREEDVVRLVLEFLSGRKLHISQLSVERETGVINGLYSDDVLFLRQLILDGQWDDVLEFVQPLEGVASFDHARFRFIVLRQKYVELLCIKGEAGLSNLDTAVEEILKVLSDLEKCCPTKEVYNYLRLLLPLPKLIDHADYRDWNPSSARVRCFDEILPLVEKFLPFDKSGKDATQEAKNDRLLHLLIKGLLYESCVEFCQRRALAGPGKDGAALQLKFSALLNSPKKLHDTDLSLLSWLQSIPAQTFAHPFEQKTLEVDVERLQKPALETSWTEHMLITPIKPKIFPHSAMPVGRPRAVDVMSRSLNPAMENVPFGQGTMWRSSLASFHLTGKKSMTTSVDRLFENEEPSFNSQITTIAEVPDSTTTTETKNPPSVAAAVRPSGSEPVQGDLLREFQRSRQRAPAEEIPHYQTPANNPSIKLTPPSLPNTETTSANFASDLPREKPQPSVQNGSGSGSLGSGTSGVPDLGSRPPKTQDSSGKPRFVAVTSLEDVQAIRCAEFHPAGRLYAVGSNSKTLRICSYPKLADLKDDHSTYQPTVLFKRTKHHKGSIYCMGWSPAGDLIATGSNDKTVKLMRFNADTCNIEGQEIELTMHDGTVRDICFIEDLSNRSSLLISGGAGDCKIYVTDCVTGTPFQAMSGHSGHILSLYTWGGAMFVSGSQDKTVRMWDLRTRGCVNMFTPITAPNSPVNKGSPVASVAVDPSGRLMVSGHEDSSCVLYDIRGNRTVQSFKPHTSDVRSVRFSPSAYYLLTAGYDNKIVLTDLQGDLTLPLPSIVVAQHQDKVISGRWHPTDFSFLSTSADKTSTLWALPPL